MIQSFAEKLTLILKVFSWSRARLASELGIDKSVVARWASGATVPSGHNLAQLSALMGRAVPGFTALDWDRDLDGLAAFLGVATGRPAASPVPTPDPASVGLALPLLDLIRSTTALRVEAYEGFYKSTRPFSSRPGLFIHDHCYVRLGPDGLLRFKMNTGGVKVEGWVLPIQSQLFLIGTEFTGGALAFAILHGVNGVKADMLDGITLTANHDAGRSPASSAVIYKRIGELSDDPADDDARLDALAAVNPVAPEGSIPEDLRRHLARDVGPAAFANGGDWVLRLPLTQSLASGPMPDRP